MDSFLGTHSEFQMHVRIATPPIENKTIINYFQKFRIKTALFLLLHCSQELKKNVQIFFIACG